MMSREQYGEAEYWADQEREAEEIRILAEGLHNTYWINFLLYSDTEEMSDAIEELVHELRRTEAAKNTQINNLSKCINTIVANLVSNYSADLERYTIYGRTDEDYPAERYNPFEIRLRGVIAVVDGLEELDYVENFKGFVRPKYYYSRKSRFRAKPAFIEMLEQCTGLTPAHIKKHNFPELVILRNRKGHDEDYRERQQTRDLRNQLMVYNRALDASEILIDPAYDLPVKEDYNIDKKQYHRVFNLRSFNLGGRYYGPWWQLASKETRRHIFIDGEKTVECDFKAQHVHILYHLAGLNYFDIHGKGDDPYLVEGYSLKYRNLMKMVFLKLTGVKNRNGLNIGMGQWVSKEPEYAGIDHKSASTAFISKHQSITNFLYRRYDKNLSLRLQNIDSRISEHVITELLNDGIIVLDIHDSFIVKRNYEERVREAMINGFRAHSIISVPEITSNL